MARQPYSKRYPKIVRAKRITLPLAIAALLVCWVAAMGNPGSFWWLGLSWQPAFYSGLGPQQHARLKVLMVVMTMTT